MIYEEIIKTKKRNNFILKKGLFQKKKYWLKQEMTLYPHKHFPMDCDKAIWKKIIASTRNTRA